MGSGCIRYLSKRHLCRFSPERPSLGNVGVFTESPFRTIHQQRYRAWARDFPQKSRTRTSDPKISNPFHSSLPSRSYSTPSSPKTGLLGWYLGMLQARPILTKAVSTSLIFAASDLTSQMITLPASSPFDKVRTLRMASYGLLILGPCQHVWFNFVSNTVPKRDVLSTLKKILMGQALFGPVINTVFFSYNAILQGENSDEIVAKLKRDLPRTLLSGVLYWPGCDFVTFKYVPVHLQPLVNSSCSYIWTIYLTYMANLKPVDDEE